MSIEILLQGLDEFQREAVVGRPDRPELVVAGAGAGKTRVLTRRIAYLMRFYGLPPHQILAITYTKKARAEMQERLYDLLGDDADQVEVWTYHAWGLHLIQNGLAEYVGLSPNVKSAQDGQIYKAAAGAASAMGLRVKPEIVVKAINMAKVGHADRALDFLSLRDTDTLNELVKRYNRLLRDQDLIDFADMINLVVRALSKHKAAREMVWDRIKHVCADEYQDSNRPQSEMLAWLAGPRGALTVVGDGKQRINGHQGEVPTIITDFTKFYRDLNPSVVNLKYSYRLTEALASISNAFAALLPSHTIDTVSRVDPAVRPNVQPELHIASNSHEELAWMVSHLQERKASGAIEKWNDVLVLVRTNRFGEAVGAAMRGRIPYRTGKGESVSGQKGVPALLGWVRLLEKPDDSSALVAAADAPAYRLGRAFTIGGPWTLAKLQVNWPAGLSAADERGLGYFLEAIELIRALHSGGGDPTEVFDAIVRRSGLDGAQGMDRRTLVNLRTRVKKDQNLAGIDLIAGEEAVMDFSDRVSIFTVHQSKGLEYPWVIVSGATDGMFPSQMSSSPDQLEGEANIFYVALTRSLQHLLITCSTEQVRRDGDGEGRISPYVEVIRDHLRVVG